MKTFFHYSLLQYFINNKIFGNNDYDTFTPFSIPLVVFLQIETPDLRRELEPTKIENFSVTINIYLRNDLGQFDTKDWLP